MTSRRFKVSNSLKMYIIFYNNVFRIVLQRVYILILGANHQAHSPRLNDCMYNHSLTAKKQKPTVTAK